MDLIPLNIINLKCIQKLTEIILPPAQSTAGMCKITLHISFSFIKGSNKQCLNYSNLKTDPKRSNQNYLGMYCILQITLHTLTPTIQQNLPIKKRLPSQ
jgi:hypothetical protein